MSQVTRVVGAEHVVFPLTTKVSERLSKVKWMLVGNQEIFYAATMKTISEEELPAYIRTLRGTRTQAEFGGHLGVSKQAVTQYENGTTQPKSEILAKLGLSRCYRVIK